MTITGDGLKSVKKQQGRTAFRIVVDCSVQAAAWRARLPRPKAVAVKAISAALAAAGIPVSTKAVRSLEISLVLADNAFVQTLNRDYRGKDKPTNVLSFPAMEADELEHLGGISGEQGDENAEILLGDIVLALETVELEAQLAEKSVKDHFCHLVVHGLLHLIGYDHEHDRQAEQMEKLETSILATMGVADPYILATPSLLKE